MESAAAPAVLFPSFLLFFIVSMASGGGNNNNNASGPPIGTSENAYSILLVPRSASAAIIRKSYLKLALKHHPDKISAAASPAVRAHHQQTFDTIQKAYDVLNDPDARAALDLLLEARDQQIARDSARDAKRQRLAEELREREAMAKATTKPTDAAAAARMRFARELERIRQQKEDDAYGISGQQQHARTSHAAALDAVVGPGAKRRTALVRWERGGNEITAADVALAVAGEQDADAVEDVVMRDGKSNKRSALVVFATEVALAQAFERQRRGILSQSFRISAVETEASSAAATASAEPRSDMGGVSFADFEKETLRLLRERASAAT